MVKRLFFVFICLLVPVLCFTGCKDTKSYDGKVKIIFELEGGIYQNCTMPIVHYYDFTEDSNLITDPTTLTGAVIEKAGYVLEGWYKTKVENAGIVSYQDKWNFETDYVTSSGITLFAKWTKNIKYKYDVCYRDENNEVKVLGSYEVKAGEKFDDYVNYAKKRSGYTPLSYCDESGKEWDANYGHPGGDTDLTIQVFVKYLKGDYSIVRTAEDLLYSVNDNIYLLNDIDLEGEELSFNNYKKNFIGNNHTISNFSIYYDASRNGLMTDLEDVNSKSLYISLFGNVDGANIENVNFENVTVKVSTMLSTTYKIYVAPICVSSKNSTIKNVTFSGVYSCDRLPDGFNKEENLIYVNNDIYYVKDEQSIFENNDVNILINE